MMRPKDNNLMIHRFDSINELSNELYEFIKDLSEKEIKNKNKFIISLSGGSLIKILSKACIRNDHLIDFSKWFVFFVDERYVPLDHIDSNYKAAKDNIFNFINIPENQIYTVDYNNNHTLQEIAELYEKKMAIFWNHKLPNFDLILLGMGPDGHTCSLFPNHSTLNEKIKWILPVTNSPKPPLERITMTFPVINNAHNIAFVATGKSKAALLPLVIGKDKDKLLPASQVNPIVGKLHWFIDELAAEYIKDK